MPYYPAEDRKLGHDYEIVTYWEKLVSDYTGLSFSEIQELDYIDYLQFRRDAFIYQKEQTEKGREYLDNAWRLTQTAPDKSKLREKFGKED